MTTITPEIDDLAELDGLFEIPCDVDDSHDPASTFLQVFCGCSHMLCDECILGLRTRYPHNETRAWRCKDCKTVQVGILHDLLAYKPVK